MDREAWQTTVYRAATRDCAVHFTCLFSVTPYYNLRKKQNKTFFPLQPTPLGHPNSTGALVRQLGCKPHSESLHFLVCKIVMVIPDWQACSKD